MKCQNSQNGNMYNIATWYQEIVNEISDHTGFCMLN